MSFEIDKTVPLPDDISYPLMELEVGDSFVFPLEKRSSLQSLASRYKRSGREFKIRKVNETQGRVWRAK